MKREINIDGNIIKISAAAHDGGQCGILYSAWDSYGEPTTYNRFFSNPKDALDDREASLRKMFA
jgi:hypothetical protein